MEQQPRINTDDTDTATFRAHGTGRALERVTELQTASTQRPPFAALKGWLRDMKDTKNREFFDPDLLSDLNQ
jgi:hypothetical protein